MPEPMTIPTACCVHTDRGELRIVKTTYEKEPSEYRPEVVTVTHYVVEKETTDALGDLCWTNLCYLGDGFFPNDNKDYKGNDLPPWLFDLVKYFYEKENP
jgi:hypothetical protein